MKTLFKNATIIQPSGRFEADVLVDGAKIHSIGNAAAWQDVEASQTYDLEGKLLFPGAIDAHCHIQLDTGIYKTPDNWLLGSEEAALGGITTVIDFVSPTRDQSLREALTQRIEEAKDSIVDYSFHMTLIETNDAICSELDSLLEWGISSLKLYTTYKPNYYLDDHALFKALHHAARSGLISLIHCENDAMVTHFTKQVMGRSTGDLSDHADTRPQIAEDEAVFRVLQLAEAAGAAVVIAHNSSPESPKAVKEARQKGVKAFCETAPQYLLLNDALYEGPDAWRFILQPPLRSHSAANALMQALHGGEIDMLITDHCAYSKKQKLDNASLGRIPGGLPGLETLLRISAGLPSMTWESLSALIAENPAKIYGLWPQKGSIQVGFDADLVIIDDKASVLTEDTLRGVAQYSPFHNQPMRGIIEKVYRRGQCIVDRGELCYAWSGQFVHARKSALL